MLRWRFDYTCRAVPSRNPIDQPLHCAHFGVCGSCSLLDQPIAWQLHDKVAACEALLAPFLAGSPLQWEAPRLPQRHFRTKLLYPVRTGPDRRPVVGMFEWRSHRVVAIDECQTQDEWLTGLGRAVQPILHELELRAFDPGRRRAIVKAIWARLAGGTGEVLAGIVTAPGAFAEGAEFAARWQAAAAALRSRRPRQLVGVVHSVSDRDDDFLLGDRHSPLLGRDHVVDRRDGLTFRVSAGSFYQVHAGAHELLYRPALALCGDVRGQTVIDGYGGVGTFGLRLAKAGAARVTIVEDNPAACRDAEHNAKGNTLPQVRVVRSEFGGANLPAGADLLVVDPPRAGLGASGQKRALALQPRRVLCVACDADSLARDLAALTAGGYRLTAARLCDLFPHTEHVELLALLERTT